MNTRPHTADARLAALSSVDRRRFLQTAGVAAGATLLPLTATADDKKKEEAKKKDGKAAKKPAKSETPAALVTKLYEGLDEKQRKDLTFPFDHPRRQQINNNWRITKVRVNQLKADQQQLVREIVRKLHHPDYAKTVMKQIEHDNEGRGGFGGCSLALFGKPGKDKFEFVFTGRHVTRRVDGNSSEGTAFGGPIFYGHAARKFHEDADHPGNVYWYQAKRANELFASLDEKQQQLALRSDPRPERAKQTVALQGAKGALYGAPYAELNKDQQALFRKVLQDVLKPFRAEDVAEAEQLLKKVGYDKLHIAYYQNLDIGNDKTWDVWQIEGPSMVWYFRGAPHVHTWVHIRG